VENKQALVTVQVYTILSQKLHISLRQRRTLSNHHTYIMLASCRYLFLYN